MNNSVESNFNQTVAPAKTVRELKKGRRSLVRGRVHYYLRCEKCRVEFNISPKQIVGDTYICPDCDDSGEEDAWDG